MAPKTLICGGGRRLLGRYELRIGPKSSCQQMEEIFMSIAVGFSLTLFIGLLIVGSLIGYLVLSLSISKTSRKYREFVRGLKKQNQYEAWAKQHSSLIRAERILQYGSILCLLALFIFIGTVKGFISAPRIILVISAVLVYLFWPFCFVSTLVISRLYKKVPELWGEAK